MASDGMSHNRQTEAGSGGVAGAIRAVEPVEDMRKIGFCDARSFVTDDDGVALHSYRHRSTGGRELHRIIEQVGDSPLQGGLVTQHQMGLQVDVEFQVRAASSSPLDCFGHRI